MTVTPKHKNVIGSLTKIFRAARVARIKRNSSLYYAKN